MIRVFVAEFVATLLFVFIGCGSVVDVNTGTLTDTVNISFAFGLAIAVLVSCVNDISGGHINPAVTYALVITGNLPVKTGLVYFCAQMLGAITGAALLRGAVGTKFSGGTGLNNVTHISAGEGLVIEAVLTFLLVFTVFNVAIRKAAAAHIAPLIIGFAVLVAHLSSVTLTGTGINPARSFGPALIQGIFDNHWIYWIGPWIGASIAPGVYFLLYGTVKPEEIKLKDANANYHVRGKELEEPDRGGIDGEQGKLGVSDGGDADN